MLANDDLLLRYPIICCSSLICSDWVAFTNTTVFLRKSTARRKLELETSSNDQEDLAAESDLLGESLTMPMIPREGSGSLHPLHAGILLIPVEP